jgi:hypothetical protein
VISSANAALLLSKFQSEATLLKVSFSKGDPYVSLSLQARVVDFTEGKSLSLITETKDFCVVSLKDCRFEYGDERELPELVREWATRKYEGALAILLSSDERLTLRAFRF